METALKCLFFVNIFIFVYSNILPDIINQYGINIKSYMFWPNATIPFFINPEHFDHTQSLMIMTALAMFSFKTCLKFAPVMTPPADSQHVLAIINPQGRRRCEFDTEGHSVFAPHELVLGYDCLQSPNIDMMIMKALGFTFEHNKQDRDQYIDVLMENIEPSAHELFTKEASLPLELRALPYDINSVLHFGSRDYSKNGHRTILFKDHKVQQNRVGLTETDLRKIEIVYGPECLKRDRQEKIELCQSYPGVARRKRDLTTVRQSLRVNPEITPPPDTKAFRNLNDTVKELGIENEVQEIIDKAYKLSSRALKNVREKYCFGAKSGLRSNDLNTLNKTSDILGIVEVITDYAKTIVDDALANLTVFCEKSISFENYLRLGCLHYDHEGRCKETFRSTKAGAVKHSTQHRPTYFPSTIHKGNPYYGQFHRGRKHGDDRDGQSNVTDTANAYKPASEDPNIKDMNATKQSARRKRHLEPDSDIVRFQDGRKVNRYRNKYNSKPIDLQRFKYDKMKNTEESEESSLSSDGGWMKKELVKKKRIHKKDLAAVEIDEDKPQKKKQKEIEMLAQKQKRSKLNAVQVVPLSKANKEFYEERKWPTGEVVYVIKENSKYDTESLRSRLEEVNSIVKARTCARLKEVTEDEAKSYKDYLVIDDSIDYVTGRVGGRQVFGSVDMLSGGQHRQHTAMMAMAMLGFYFEIARHDRDQYIRVHNRHIRPDKLHHFEKIREDATLPLPYDYKSATHPAWQFWRKLGKTGISTVATYKNQDPDGTVMKSLGQNEDLLSEIDIIKINSVYGTNCFNTNQSKGKQKKIHKNSVIKEY